jgi:hypothetical protein
LKSVLQFPNVLGYRNPVEGIAKMSRARTGWLAAFLVFGAVGLPNLAAAQGAPASCPQGLDRGIPAPPSNALDGSAFAAQVGDVSGTQRDGVTEQELLAGDIPQFLRHLRPVTLRGRTASGKAVSITVCVMPDYLAVGSDKDFVRVPMGLRAAVAIADRFGFVLPTTKIVDAIYAQADVHVPPEPLTAGPQMRSTAYFVLHNRMVRQESLAEGAKLGMLIAGQKKDLVITNRLRTHPGRVAIYGWHRENGRPIQPLSTVHGENYADYSHGIRLVSTIAYVDNKERSLLDILQDPNLAPVVSAEGPIPKVGVLLASLDGQRREANSSEPEVASAGRLQSDHPSAIR